MANINETISEVEKINPKLAQQIRKYVKDHSYGLVFERNLPEAIRLYKKQPAINDIVNVLAPRGKKETEENSVPWRVKSITNGVAELEHDGESKNVPVEDICVLMSYKDVIYPGLKEIDRVERGYPDDPYHMVISAENYHALEALSYAYTGKVDCIYIDPPYNTGARDWKYNNDYVGTDDKYRHSKWLAFMERRLKIAKQLLNPNDSVLIVTIDEKEYLRLGLLLEQVFPSATIQMISTVVNPVASYRKNSFARSNEYIYIVSIGVNGPEPLVLSNYWKGGYHQKDNTKPNCWQILLRSSTDREKRPNLFYPIFLNKDATTICSVGMPLKKEDDISEITVPDNQIVIFPISRSGIHKSWHLSRDTLIDLLNKGFVRLGKPNGIHTSISYIREQYQKKILMGEISIMDIKNDTIDSVPAFVPTTQWIVPTHNAMAYGTHLLNSIIFYNKFPYPKSLYAVHDVLRFFVEKKPNALIVDFFAGSGTTLHAVNLLNAEDGGQRRCICVTNNAVSEAEEKKFIKKGLRPCDPEWEQYGIANYVTWPRTVCSIEGHDINGKPLNGDYGKPSKNIDLGYSLPMSDGFKANAVFCELTYESAWPIRLDNAFNAIAPILWMQAGCKGRIIRKMGKSYSVTPYYAVLFDYKYASKFCEKVKNTPTVKTVFVVTDDQRRYSNMCNRLPGIAVHRLYETFLKTFEIYGEGGLD